MFADHPDVAALEDPQRELERALIDEFWRSHGYERTRQSGLADPQMDLLMKQAVAYASGRLSEIQSRARFVREIHGAEGARKPQRQ